MNTSNDFFRLAKEGEEATHFLETGRALTKKEFEDLAGADRVGDFVAVVKVGWFSPDEKPKKDGDFLCIVRGEGLPYFSVRFFVNHENTFHHSSFEEILAWAHLPPFEQDKEDWEKEFDCNNGDKFSANTQQSKEIIRDKMIFKTAFLAGQKSRETK